MGKLLIIRNQYKRIRWEMKQKFPLVSQNIGILGIFTSFQFPVHFHSNHSPKCQMSMERKQHITESSSILSPLKTRLESVCSSFVVNILFHHELFSSSVRPSEVINLGVKYKERNIYKKKTHNFYNGEVIEKSSSNVMILWIVMNTTNSYSLCQECWYSIINMKIPSHKGYNFLVDKRETGAFPKLQNTHFQGKIAKECKIKNK
ncbi:hypothetical protein HPG69_007026 [Diceros bicornis minor]|uniref:Uncharacterized protein n=1 Tax=Diceros bicornis minor TaxID=77932 RepID=A0A7J7F273_DICBM|nr:hypothetical protein HPG69_007026 [Diceros bicornis minor]